MSNTKPIEAHHVKKGNCIMLKGRPCKIVDVKTSKTGKHGHAKCNITGVCVLSGKKCNEVHPGHIILQEADPTKLAYDLMLIDEKEGFMEVFDLKTNEQRRFPWIKGEELYDTLKAALDADANASFEVTIITAPVGDSDKPEADTTLENVLESWKVQTD